MSSSVQLESGNTRIDSPAWIRPFATTPGVSALAQLEQPLPRGMRAVVKLALRRDDDGTERNRVRTFEITGIDEPEADPFAPSDATAGADGGAPSEPDYEPEQADLIAPDEPTKVVRYE